NVSLLWSMRWTQSLSMKHVLL
ncbi:secA DEAD-like domain protein, partial [Vibrio parahaemolyticus V-223/04]